MPFGYSIRAIAARGGRPLRFAAGLMDSSMLLDLLGASNSSSLLTLISSESLES